MDRKRQEADRAWHPANFHGAQLAELVAAAFGAKKRGGGRFRRDDFLPEFAQSKKKHEAEGMSPENRAALVAFWKADAQIKAAQQKRKKEKRAAKRATA
jgi:hypothetical protein